MESLILEKDCTGNRLLKLLCHIPSVHEQKKITSFFNNLMKLSSLHQQELTTLKQTKQGFLQKMFPKEGESVPEVRFPGFTGDWEDRKFRRHYRIIFRRNTKCRK